MYARITQGTSCRRAVICSTQLGSERRTVQTGSRKGPGLKSSVQRSVAAPPHQAVASWACDVERSGPYFFWAPPSFSAVCTSAAMAEFNLWLLGVPKNLCRMTP